MRRALFVAAALACALALAACGSDGGGDASETPGTVTATVSLEGGQPVGGEQRIEATSGDHVRIRITSDAPDDVHLHGYDIEAEVTPEKPAELDFDADLEGIFEIESHETETVIARLVVEP